MAETKLNPTQAFATARFKIGSFTRDCTAASGDVAYTGVGFTPKAILFFAVVDGTTKVSAGLDDGTSHFGWGGYGDSNNKADNGATSITIRNSAGNSQGGAVSALGSDGFTITWTKTGSPTGTASVYYLAFR